MTVCVAALCSHSKAIVCVADKAVNFNQYIQWDADASKVLTIGKADRKPPCVALISGEEDFSLDLVAELEKEATFGQALRSSMTVAENAYKRLLDKRIETDVLGPKLLTRTDYIALLGGPSVNSSYVQGIGREISSYEVTCGVLICGFEADRGFIFHVGFPGRARDCTHTGFATIGSGSAMALSRMLQAEASRSDGVVNCLYNSFDAKASAEIIGTVGGAWDASILLPWRAQKKVPYKIRTVAEHIWDEAMDISPLSPKFGVKFRKNIRQWKTSLVAFGKVLEPKRSVSQKAVRAR